VLFAANQTLLQWARAVVTKKAEFEIRKELKVKKQTPPGRVDFLSFPFSSHKQLFISYLQNG
jgi:hypothetical protein